MIHVAPPLSKAFLSLLTIEIEVVLRKKITIQSIHISYEKVLNSSGFKPESSKTNTKSSTSRKPVPLTHRPSHDILDGT